MPELPEVETVRRMLEATALGRTIETVRLSGLRLRESVPRDLPRRLAGRRLVAARRRGKYLLLDLDDGATLLSHLGMSGRWLFHPRRPGNDMPHVHARIRFANGSELWYQDPRRFGLLRLVPTARLASDRRLAGLGPDPVAEPPTGDALRAMARGTRRTVKDFLLDQRRVAGIGNIYASEILHRAGIDPRTRAGRVPADRWDAIARETTAVLKEAIERSGTTFSMYRTLWNEPGAYGDQLRVYDRPGEPCRACGTAIRRIVQGGRATFFCPVCQPLGTRARRGAPRPRPSRGRPRGRSRP
ncbi:MAG: bifunctional DNA-formamidopyrimidine glycosylase/DNA-(apurinic or apyrimidinic site) lyase [Candidatus Eiseniibacteriota bacterium]